MPNTITFKIIEETLEDLEHYRSLEVIKSYDDDVADQVYIDITNLHKYEEEFKELLKISYNIISYDVINMSDTLYEKYLHPYYEWCIKRRIIYPNEQFNTWISTNNTNDKLTIQINGMEHDLMIPSQLKNITLGEELSTKHRLKIQDLDSMKTTNRCIAKILEFCNNKQLDLSINQYIKLEHLIKQRISDMIVTLNKMEKHPASEKGTLRMHDFYKDLVNKWVMSGLKYIPSVIESHLSLSKYDNKNKSKLDRISASTSVINSIMDKYNYKVVGGEVKIVMKISNTEKIKTNLDILRTLIDKVSSIKE